MRLGGPARWTTALSGVLLWLAIPFIVVLGGNAKLAYHCRGRIFQGRFDDCFNDYIPILEFALVPFLVLAMAYPFARLAFSLYGPPREPRSFAGKLSARGGAAGAWPYLQLLACLGFAWAIWRETTYMPVRELLPFRLYWATLASGSQPHRSSRFSIGAPRVPTRRSGGQPDTLADLQGHCAPCRPLYSVLMKLALAARKAVRALAPNGLRVVAARARRTWRDSAFSGPRPRFAARPAMAGDTGFPHCVAEVVQEIKPTAYLEGKLANIGLSAARLDGVVIAPGETFSFWKLVGRPSAANGFRIGRSIRGGIVGGELGGGLCQVSGIAYEAGLRAGLAPVERHPHSRDLYSEEERFTPLGLDATMVWPNKDLRLSNPLAVPVQIRFAVRDLKIAASVHAPIPLDAATLEIVRTDREAVREVRVLRRAARGAVETISDDLYPAMPAEIL